MSHPIPVIDISSAIAGGDLAGPAALIDQACREVGFFQVVGHGVDESVFDDVYRSAPKVWALPADEREALRDPGDHPFYGWYTREDGAGAVLQQKWERNRFDSAEDARAHGIPEQYLDRFADNRYPTQVPDFVAATTRCFDAGRALGDRVMALFAVALGLPEGYFDEVVENDGSYFAVNDYPGESAGNEGEIALYEHSDSGTLTLLHQRGDYEGLEVVLVSGERIKMPIIPEAIVVNIGDLMARWTNDRWIATRHRVVLGQPEQARTSITTFHTPSVDTVVSPFATCIGDGTEYEPISIYDWEPVFLAKSFA